MRVKKVLRTALGLCDAVVIVASELQERGEGTRPALVVQVRTGGPQGPLQAAWDALAVVRPGRG